MKSSIVKALEEFRGGRNSCQMRNAENALCRKLTQGALEGREDEDRTLLMVVSSRPVSQRQGSVGQVHRTHSDSPLPDSLVYLLS